MDESIGVARREDGVFVVEFNPQAVAASEITRHIVTSYAVTDLAVEEADIEAIIREIYDRGSADGV
jgi:ABC-type uncharacterized transport system ATPase subunit